MIPSNPCRRLRVRCGRTPERPHAEPEQVEVLVDRAGVDFGLLIETAAYTGLRWGELVGLQWSCVNLDDGVIVVDAAVGALHEVNGKLELGPPKTASSARTVHLPDFLVVKLAEHRRRNPDARFVFTGADGGLLRRSNFRRRVWLPVLAGNPESGEKAILPGFHFHDLRHTHKTWMIEDRIPMIAQDKRMGHHPRGGAAGIYSHVTIAMINEIRTVLQARWQRVQDAMIAHAFRADPYRPGSVVNINCSQFAPTDAEQPAGDDHRRAV